MKRDLSKAWSWGTCVPARAEEDCECSNMMDNGPTNAEKVRRLPWVTARDATNSIFCQLTFFGSVFILFLDELGLEKGRIGLLLSLFPFCGLIALFIAPAVARAGFKRVFLLFYGTRKIVTAGLFLTPVVLAKFGLNATVTYVAGVILVFAVCRAVAETALYPWAQETVPDKLRGKFDSLNSVVATVASIAAAAVAGHVMGLSAGLGKFMFLIAVGVFFGLISAWTSSFIPGGAPSQRRGLRTAPVRRLLAALRDGQFVLFLGGLALVNLAGGAVLSFVPLFMKEEVGLAPSMVVYLQISTFVGATLTSFLWGWAADRFGSKPVMLSGLSLMTLLPPLWAFMPRHTAISAQAALALAFLWGLVSIGWGIGSGRHLFVSVVPRRRRSEYMAIWYASMGLIGGVAPLIAGRILDLGAAKGLRGKFLLLPIDPYTPLFAGGFVLLAGGVLLLSGLRGGGELPARKFFAMFLQGNPFLALDSMVRLNLARDEHARISLTERLGEAKSPLGVDELLDGLTDPSFNVRYEAVISIARTRPDPRLVDALLAILEGEETDMSIAAAWALARIADPRAIPRLREKLASGLPLLRAQAARSLGTLGDRDSVPRILELFRSETQDGLKVVYGSALGSLKVTEAAQELLAYLRGLENENLRRDLTLAIARITGNERYFIRLWRNSRSDPGTNISMALSTLERRLSGVFPQEVHLLARARVCAHGFAENDLDGASTVLADLATDLLEKATREPFRTILVECAMRLRELGPQRSDYVVLCLHTINALVNDVLRGPQAIDPAT
ncbi:MAG: MFS transporter [Planctomycetota bacterium]